MKHLCMCFHLDIIEMASLLLRSLLLLSMSLNQGSGDRTVTAEESGLVESDVEFVYHKAEFEGLRRWLLRLLYIVSRISLEQFRKTFYRKFLVVNNLGVRSVFIEDKHYKSLHIVGYFDVDFTPVFVIRCSIRVSVAKLRLFSEI